MDTDKKKRVFVVVTGRTAPPQNATYSNIKIKLIDGDKRLSEGDLPQYADDFVMETKFMPHKVSLLVKQWAEYIGANYHEVRGARGLSEKLSELNA